MWIRDFWVNVVANFRGYFSSRIWHIEKGLYQSGVLHGCLSIKACKRLKIDLLVDLEGLEDEYKDHFPLYIHWFIGDGALPDVVKLQALAKEIYYFILDQNYRVLVHCGAGRNRASLINGCVLYLMGYRGDKIIKRLRDKRPGALSNHNFEGYLRGLVD